MAKLLQEKCGVGSHPSETLWNKFSKTDLICVKEYYYSDEITRIMPGQKDHLSVTNDNGKTWMRSKTIDVM